MRISLFGVGYVGSVSAACLARDGHHVVAVDTHPQKVDALNQGRAPLAEPGLDALIRAGVVSRRLCAHGSVDEAVAQTDASIVCVGTPSAGDGSLDLSAVERVSAAIGRAMGRKTPRHTVIVRSTLKIGTMSRVVIPLVEQASGLPCGEGFGLAYYPEFLREGCAIRDYDDPCHAVAAVTDGETLTRLHALQPKSAAPLATFTFEEAEAIKGVSNAWRALKVGFANEIGGVLAARGLDSHTVMQAVCEDNRLNISSAYMTPGFAFGGSCLPKDLRALSALARETGRPVPLLSAALTSNGHIIEHAATLVQAQGDRRVSIIGLAFKPGTDDLRESPYLALAERLVSKGYDLRLFDPEIRMDRLTGANLHHALQRLPQLSRLLCDTLEAAVQHGRTLILGHPGPGAAALAMAEADQQILDLVRVRPDLRTSGAYRGLHW